MAGIIVTLKHYEFSLYDPCTTKAQEQEEAAYLQLGRTLKKQGNQKTFGNFSSSKPEGRYKVDVVNLFSNQMNATFLDGKDGKESVRLFDWIEFSGRYSCSGYYVTGRGYRELRKLRRETLECGYCRHSQPAEFGNKFCHVCLGSKFLKEKDLHLLRLHRISDGYTKKRAELNPQEKKSLLKKYFAAQEARKDSERYREFQKILDNHKLEEVRVKGMSWLYDREVNIQDVAYNKHRDIFTFGYPTPIEPNGREHSKILGIISEFPYEYEIKLKNGETQSNGLR